ncbi:UDP-N-acetylmuramate--L-alanine ligase [bacterium]|nr:UDP-N-acetylmuramate--L-alanine ligase [bacterium]
MSGIAEVLLNLGFKVTGSDLQSSSVTEHLHELGASIYQGHSAGNISDADVVVISSAVPESNEEVTAAHRKKIPVIRRAEMLGELMRMKQGVAVAGTHGKTTTTSMTGLVLQQGGLDPTLIVGGKLRSLDTNAKLGEGEYVVVEADEYDHSFLQLTPVIAVITNIENEHLDCYKDLDDIKRTFTQFANKVPFYGAVILCLDEEPLQEMVTKLERRIVTYGLFPQAEIRAESVTFSESGSEYDAYYRNKKLGRIKLNLPGIYNVKNSLAAIAVGFELEIDFKNIKKALEGFTGVHRRFEIKGKEKNVIIVDDYAHHPTEIKASLKGAKDGYSRRIITIFQPHLYSRTRDFYEDFGKSFFNTDILIVTDIYPAREKPIEGVSGRLIADAAELRGHRNVNYIPDKNKVADFVGDIIKPGDMVITMGAGDIWKIGEEILKRLKS